MRLNWLTMIPVPDNYDTTVSTVWFFPNVANVNPALKNHEKDISFLFVFHFGTTY